MPDMSSPLTQSAVALCVFIRPEHTRRVIETLAQARPPRLYVISDAPRNEREADLNRQTLALFDTLPWPCHIQINHAPHNLGVRHRIATGLDWVFQHEEQAIILEDDCIPHPDFFPYCDELLQRYADDSRIMHIGGNNYQQGQLSWDYSYYFSRHTHCWGWATWRRAWQHYDANLSHWETFKTLRGMADYSNDRFEEDYFMHCVQQVADGHVSSWAYIWGYSCLLHHGLAIVPAVNLVSNIGFGHDATHTTTNAWYSNLQTQPILPLQHPPHVIRHREADGRTFATHFNGDAMRREYHWHRRLRRLPASLKRRFLQRFSRD